MVKYSECGLVVCGFMGFTTFNFTGGYLYSYTEVVLDGGAGYDINTPLGSWTATNQCHPAEGSALSFYAAMR